MNRTVEIVNKILPLFDSLDCELNYNNDYELLISIVLSAQTTDKSVNKVNRALFDKYPDFLSLSKANKDDVFSIIKYIGLANTKSANIINLSKQIISIYKNKIPLSIEELSSLSGVGRKTANVFLQVYHKIPSIAVDTHVYRVCSRLKITKENQSVLKCEETLRRKLPRYLYNDANMAILLFGRYYCKSLKPLCVECVVKDYCRNKT